MDLPKLKKLIKLFENSEISELELEQEGWRVLMKKGYEPQHVIAHHAPQAVPAAPHPKAKPAEPGEAESVEETKNHIIKSPMVGTFYRASSPTSPPFVDEGDLVRKGDTLCIVEAMKLMNEIESEVSGRIVKIFPENGKPVEFGEALFEIDTAS